MRNVSEISVETQGPPVKCIDVHPDLLKDVTFRLTGMMDRLDDMLSNG